MSILVATDFSDDARSALRMAAAEAKKRGVHLSVLHCVDSVGEKWEYLEDAPENVEQQVKKAARKRLEEEFDDAVPREKQPKVDDFLVLEGHAAEGIVETANSGDFELVVVGATGGGALARLVLGSTAEEVVRASETPVLVVPAGSDPDSIARILAPVDLSECSRASLLVASERARREAAELLVMHVSTLPAGALALMEWEPSEEERQAHRNFTSQQFADFMASVDLEGLDYDEVIRFGAPDREIVQAARDRDADLIVMGTHGRRGFERLFLGSTATKVLRRIPCPVLTIRHRE